MKKIKYLLIALIATLLIACEKDISIDFSANHKEIVIIEGMLYPNKMPQIFISKSHSFFSPKVSPQEVFARGAIITISSGSMVDVLVADSIFNKFRCRWEPYYQGKIAVEYGKTYTLNVSFEGKNYTANTTINQKAIKIEKIVCSPKKICSTLPAKFSLSTFLTSMLFSWAFCKDCSSCINCCFLVSRDWLS